MVPKQRNILLLVLEIYNAITLRFQRCRARIRGRVNLLHVAA